MRLLWRQQRVTPRISGKNLHEVWEGAHARSAYVHSSMTRYASMGAPRVECNEGPAEAPPCSLRRRIVRTILVGRDLQRTEHCVERGQQRRHREGRVQASKGHCCEIVYLQAIDRSGTWMSKQGHSRGVSQAICAEYGCAIC